MTGFDGASKSNPGMAGAGVFLVGQDKEIRLKTNNIGWGSNNLAESTAAWYGAELIQRIGIDRVRIYGDLAIG